MSSQGRASLFEAPLRLSELQRRLALLAGEALKRGDEDPRVRLYDLYGGTSEIQDLRLDWAPETLAEADADVRHPVVELFPVDPVGDGVIRVV